MLQYLNVFLIFGGASSGTGLWNFNIEQEAEQVEFKKSTGELFNLCARVFVRRDFLISALFYPAQIVYNGRELS